MNVFWRYETLSFRNRKFKTNFPFGKRVKKFFYEKCISDTRKVNEVFQKILSTKCYCRIRKKPFITKMSSKNLWDFYIWKIYQNATYINQNFLPPPTQFFLLCSQDDFFLCKKKYYNRRCLLTKINQKT